MNPCPVCWRLVEPTTKKNIGHHRDKLGVETCPTSGEPFRITRMVEPSARTWIRDRLDYQQPRHMTWHAPVSRVRVPANSGRTPLVKRVVA